MSMARKKMKTALNEWVIPQLISRGFSGSYPTLRRAKDDRIDLITFQFTVFDEAFCVSIAKCPPEGITFKSGEYIPIDKATAHHCPITFKLGAPDNLSSHWFKYNPRPLELKDQDKFPFLSMYPDSLLKFKHIADDIIEIIEKYAEPWWEQSEPWWKNQLPVYNRLFFDIQFGFEKKMSYY